MWLDDREWEELYILAHEKLSKARLELLAAEGAIKSIEAEIMTVVLRNKGITWKNIGEIVLVDFSDYPNSPCIYEGHSKGIMKLRHLSKRGKPHKNTHEYNLQVARCTRLAPDNTWKVK